jgi:hypothetical protein
MDGGFIEQKFGKIIAANGRQSATLPEANRAEGNVGEARATSAPNPEGPQDSKGRNADWLVRRWIFSGASKIA